MIIPKKQLIVIVSLVAFLLLFELNNHSVKAQNCVQLSNTSSAVLNGQIINTGGDPNMTIWFEWKRSDSSSWISTPQRNVYIASTPYSFSENLTGLSPCTVYEYKSKARNSAGVSEGSVMCFRTSCVMPINVNCSASPNPANVNQQVSFTANVSGGLPPYTYSWSGACSGGSSTCLNSFNNVGTFYTTLFVVDSQRNSASTQCSITVRASLPQVITLPPVETL